jgi:hypothetical protein
VGDVTDIVFVILVVFEDFVLTCEQDVVRRHKTMKPMETKSIRLNTISPYIGK